MSEESTTPDLVERSRRNGDLPVCDGDPRCAMDQVVSLDILQE
jgi:hypothetical protein